MAVMIMMMVVLVTVVNGHPHHAGAAANNDDKVLNTICGATTYKEACMNALRPVAGKGATPQGFVEAGVKVAMDEMDKAFKLTDTLLAKPSPSKKTVESCKHLLEQAKDRLQEAMTQVRDVKSFKDPALLFDLRVRLGDVNTFATNCAYEMSESGAPADLQKTLKDGTAYASELSVNMLDVVTVFNSALTDKVLVPTVGPINCRLLATTGN